MINKSALENTKSRLNIHPDKEWLSKIKSFYPCGEGWVICGTLSFKNRYLTNENSKVKDFFSRYNWHLAGEYNWENVPVYWRSEFDKTERMHVHFVLMDATPEFHYLRGVENTFKDSFELSKWFKNNWKEGVSHFRKYENTGWIDYITKPNSMMDSCFSPPIHYLKRQILKKSSQAETYCLN